MLQFSAVGKVSCLHPRILMISELSIVGSRFTTGLRSQIFGCKSNRRYLNGLNSDKFMGQTN